MLRGFTNSDLKSVCSMNCADSWRTVSLSNSVLLRESVIVGAGAAHAAIIRAIAALLVLSGIVIPFIL